MVTSHPQHKVATAELSEVFFGPYQQRTKRTRVPAPAVLKPRAQAWYAKFAAVSL